MNITIIGLLCAMLHISVSGITAESPNVSNCFLPDVNVVNQYAFNDESNGIEVVELCSNFVLDEIEFIRDNNTLYLGLSVSCNNKDFGLFAGKILARQCCLIMEIQW